MTPFLDATAAVHDALVADGWEGTVAKRISVRYSCGRRTTAWIKLESPAAIERDRMRVASALRPAAQADSLRSPGVAHSGIGSPGCIPVARVQSGQTHAGRGFEAATHPGR